MSAEHAANVMREEQGNKDLTLRDAVVKFLSDDPSKDRIFRRIKKSYEVRGECCSHSDTRRIALPRSLGSVSVARTEPGVT